MKKMKEDHVINGLLPCLLIHVLQIHDNDKNYQYHILIYQ